MNHIMIAGHLGSDPETRFTSGGQKVTSFRVACNSRRGGKDDTMWVRVTVWGEQFDRLMPYLKKGSAVMVHGELHKPEIYNSRDGTPQVSIDMTASQINFSPFGKGDRSNGQQQQTQNAAPSHDMASVTPAQGMTSEPAPFSEDEIPF
ncbi:MAG: Single-stranded DNA-binding protein [Chlamydiia bacterium]|nr:Single-stranded DNA-binding protein [Chlamydiia bacterium]MCH9615846.1 Single-stranded DNA-binding protein [Chlamydiia bacterium]MCH9628751.1 Single-stranded DNA-binding protein [Chlamydiia bacterium]